MIRHLLRCLFRPNDPACQADHESDDTIAYLREVKEQAQRSRAELKRGATGHPMRDALVSPRDRSGSEDRR